MTSGLMELILGGNEWLNSLVWGPPFMILLVGTGINLAAGAAMLHALADVGRHSMFKAICVGPSKRVVGLSGHTVAGLNRG